MKTKDITLTLATYLLHFSYVVILIATGLVVAWTQWNFYLNSGNTEHISVEGPVVLAPEIALLSNVPTYLFGIWVGWQALQSLWRFIYPTHKSPQTKNAPYSKGSELRFIGQSLVRGLVSLLLLPLTIVLQIIFFSLFAHTPNGIQQAFTSLLFLPLMIATSIHEITSRLLMLFMSETARQQHLKFAKNIRMVSGAVKFFK